MRQLNTTHSLNRNLLLWYLAGVGAPVSDAKPRSLIGVGKDGSYAGGCKAIHGQSHAGGAGCYKFNGSTTRLQFPALGIFGGATAWSMSIWVNPSVTSGNYVIMQTRAERDMAIRTNFGALEVFWYNGVVNSASAGSVSLNTWVHLCAVWDVAASLLRMYKNGVQTATVATGTPSTVSDINCLGSQYYSGTDHQLFTGLLDDFRVWNRALSAAEVSLLYKTSASGNRQTLARKTSVLDLIPAVAAIPPAGPVAASVACDPSPFALIDEVFP